MIKTPEQVIKEGINGYINNDFLWSEFIKDKTPALEILKNIQKVAYVLSVYKHKLFDGQPITITSGYRSIAQHVQAYKDLGITDLKKIPMGSYHLKGLAADFTVKGFAISQLYRLLDVAHFGGLEYPDDQNRIHIDLRGSIWRFKNNNKIIASHYNALQHDKIFRK